MGFYHEPRPDHNTENSPACPLLIAAATSLGEDQQFVEGNIPPEEMKRMNHDHVRQKDVNAAIRAMPPPCEHPPPSAPFAVAAGPFLSDKRPIAFPREIRRLKLELFRFE